MMVIMKETPAWEKFDSIWTTIMWQQTNPASWIHVMENFWVKPVWMIHDASSKRKQKFEAIMEIDDKIEKNVDDMEIDES